MGEQVGEQVGEQEREKEKFSAWKGFLVLLVCMMLGGVIYRGATVTLPALFERNLPTVVTAVNNLFQGSTISGNVVATMTISILYLVGMYGQYMGGRFGERFDLRYGYLGFHLVTIPFAFLLGTATNMPLILLAALHSFFPARHAAFGEHSGRQIDSCLDAQFRLRHEVYFNIRRRCLINKVD